MPDDIKLPGGAHANKKVVLAVVGGVIIIGGYMYYKNKNAQTTADQTIAANTTSAADTGTTIDPQTGFPYGSEEDQAALASLSFGILPTQFGGGGGLGGLGGGGTGISGPGGFVNNAEWAQAAEAAMGSNGNDAIAAALGKYLTGQNVTPDQQTIIQEAIAIENAPPVPGTSGFPPNIHLGTGGTGGGGGGTPKVTVPNVVGRDVNQADQKLKSVGLTVSANPGGERKGFTRRVTRQSPKSGAKVNKGSHVSLTWHYEKNRHGQ